MDNLQQPVYLKGLDKPVGVTALPIGSRAEEIDQVTVYSVILTGGLRDDA